MEDGILTPVRIRYINSQPHVEWLRLQDAYFTEPFFSHTVRSAATPSNNKTVLTNMDGLHESDVDAIQPDAPSFIFHCSRCGSTAVSRALAQSPRILVVSQPSILEDLFDLVPYVQEEQIIVWLRALLLALGRRRHPAQEYHVVKMTSYLTYFLPYFRKAFPNSRRTFIYRDPVEVIVSVMSQPTLFLKIKTEPKRAARLSLLSTQQIENMSDEEWVARCIAKMFWAVIEEVDGGGALLPINYRELPNAIWNLIAPYFNISLMDTEAQAMQNSVQFYAKDNAGRRYIDDSKMKQQAATDSMIDKIKQWGQEPYDIIKGLPGGVRNSV